MNIVNRQLKFAKKKLYRDIPNDNGLQIKLYGCSTYVGFVVVTKELKNDVWGYLGRCTHEEFKNGALQQLSVTL